MMYVLNSPSFQYLWSGFSKNTDKSVYLEALAATPFINQNRINACATTSANLGSQCSLHSSPSIVFLPNCETSAIRRTEGFGL